MSYTKIGGSDQQWSLLAALAEKEEMDSKMVDLSFLVYWIRYAEQYYLCANPPFW
jgi:hypothetical protein